jgi:hypothetical protein
MEASWKSHFVLSCKICANWKVFFFQRGNIALPHPFRTPNNPIYSHGFLLALFGLALRGPSTVPPKRLLSQHILPKDSSPLWAYTTP